MRRRARIMSTVEVAFPAPGRLPALRPGTRLPGTGVDAEDAVVSRQHLRLFRSKQARYLWSAMRALEASQASSIQPVRPTLT